MRTWPVILLGLAASPSAHAFAVGTSVGIGTGGFFGADPFDLGVGFGYATFAPTLDLLFDPIVLQLHALDTVGAAIDSELYVGANLYVDVVAVPVAGPWEATVQPGGGLDVFGDPAVFVAAAEVRLGIQAQEAAGFGLYLVPAIGLAAGDGDAQLFTGGGLQLSVWFVAG